MKDLNVLEFEEVLDTDTPLGLLRGIKFGTETYHTLFMRLCRSVHRGQVDKRGGKEKENVGQVAVFSTPLDCKEGYWPCQLTSKAVWEKQSHQNINIKMSSTPLVASQWSDIKGQVPHLI